MASIIRTILAVLFATAVAASTVPAELFTKTDKNPGWCFDYHDTPQGMRFVTSRAPGGGFVGASGVYDIGDYPGAVGGLLVMTPSDLNVLLDSSHLEARDGSSTHGPPETSGAHKRSQTSLSSKILAPSDDIVEECVSPVGGDDAIGWSCAVDLVYTITMVLSSYLREKQCSLPCTYGLLQSEVKFNQLHTALWDIAAGKTTFSTAARSYTPGAPIQLLHCIKPGSSSCYDVYYTNTFQQDQNRTLHRLDAVSGSGVSTEIFGSYVFYDGPTVVQLGLGFDGTFPNNTAKAVSGDANFAIPGVSCLNLPGEVSATVGWFAATSGEAIGETQEQHDSWVMECSQFA